MKLGVDIDEDTMKDYLNADDGISCGGSESELDNEPLSDTSWDSFTNSARKNKRLMCIEPETCIVSVRDFYNFSSEYKRFRKRV